MGECFLYGNGSGDGCRIKFENYLPMGQIRSDFPPLSVERYWLAATTVGTKALFGGGTDGSYDTSEVDAYTQEGTYTAFPAFPVKRKMLAAATVGTKALFGGGRDDRSSPQVAHAEVDAYTEAGAKTTFPGLSVERCEPAAATVGTKTLFGGGINFDNYGRWIKRAEVDAYTEAGVKTVFPELSAARGQLAAATVGTKALFGGGSDGFGGAAHAEVDAYTEAGAKTVFPALSVARTDSAAATVGAKTLFGGGSNGSGGTAYAEVDAYTEAGAKTVFPELSAARGQLAAATVGTKALFGGGGSGSYSGYSEVDAYTEAGAKTALPPLSSKKRDLAAATVGIKALFGGGNYSAEVDAYIDPGAEDPQAHIRVMPSGIYNFGDGEQTVPGSIISDPSIIVDVPRPVNGYIKYKGAKYSG